MELLLKGIGFAMICCFIGLVFANQDKVYIPLLTVAGCAAVTGLIISYLAPVLDFLRSLESLGGLNREYMDVIIKAAGIGIISEIAAFICTDSGNQSLGKTVHFLGAAAVLWLSVPVFTALLELIGVFLEEI